MLRIGWRSIVLFLPSIPCWAQSAVLVETNWFKELRNGSYEWHVLNGGIKAAAWSNGTLWVRNSVPCVAILGQSSEYGLNALAVHVNQSGTYFTKIIARPPGWNLESGNSCTSLVTESKSVPLSPSPPEYAVPINSDVTPNSNVSGKLTVELRQSTLLGLSSNVVDTVNIQLGTALPKTHGCNIMLTTIHN